MKPVKSLKNGVVALGFYFVNLILQFFSRKIFLDHLGAEVLGLNTTGRAPVGRFCAAGMHGGKIFLRTEAELPFDLPSQVSAHRADAKELEEIRPFVEKYAHAFGRNAAEILRGTFQVLIPNTANPYKSLYVTN